MPRRIYQYDAGQGWEIFNKMSTWGAYIQALAVILGFWNIWKSGRSGPRAGNDPWGAPSLEWSIPSPPPVYNFATIPTVTSRYPLWDVKSPNLTAEVPHTKRGDQISDVQMGGKHVGDFNGHMNPGSPLGGQNPGADQHASAAELGIPLPYPTIKPLFVALFMTLMFGCLMLIHEGKTQLAIVGIITNALLMVIFLYGWLTAPLEPHH